MSAQTKFVFLLTISSIFVTAFGDSINNRPVIAILTAPSTFPGYDQPEIDSYVLGQDIRFLETGGCRTAWLNWNWTESKFTSVLNSVNGIAITQVPDSSVSEAVRTKYQARVTQILQYADQQFSLGKYFPLYASGDAFQTALDGLTSLSGLFTNLATNTSLQLNVSSTSRLYSMLNNVTSSYIESSYATFFGNQNGLTLSAFAADSVLKSFFKVAATAYDKNGLQFIAALEGKNHPFYFLQYKPEAIIFDWTNPNIRQNFISQQAGLAVTNFFVNETRSNFNNFTNIDVMTEYLIYTRNATIVNAANPNVYFFHITS